MVDQQLNLNINSSEIRYLGVPDIIDYRLEFVTQESETTDPIWRTQIIIMINRFGWNSAHGAYRGHWNWTCKNNVNF